MRVAAPVGVKGQEDMPGSERIKHGQRAPPERDARHGDGQYATETRRHVGFQLPLCDADSLDVLVVMKRDVDGCARARATMFFGAEVAIFRVRAALVSAYLQG